MDRLSGVRQWRHIKTMAVTGAVILSSIWVGAPSHISAAGTTPDGTASAAGDVQAAALPEVTWLGNAEVTEGDTGTNTISFTLSASPAPTNLAKLKVSVKTSNGTAQGDGTTCPNAQNASDSKDFVSKTQEITMSKATETFSVTVCGDSIVESDETFDVVIEANPTVYTIGTGTAKGTIKNDDVLQLPTVSITDSSITEGDSGTSTMRFTVSATGSASLTVNASTSATGSATGGATCDGSTDFVSKTSSPITITRGSGTFDVTVCGDIANETNETFEVVLTANPSLFTLGTSKATGTITNDDTPTVSIDTTSLPTVTEGNSGTTTMRFTVTATKSASLTVEASTTSSGSATGGASCAGNVDFIALDKSTVTITNGTGSFDVTVCGDTRTETDETVAVQLSAMTGAAYTLGTASATGTITNDDIPSVSISGATVNEGQSGTTTMSFTVSATHSASLTVNAATGTGGTARGGASCTGVNDFITRASTPVNVVNGTGVFTVTVCGDTDFESDETVEVVLSAVSGATYTMGTSRATGTITNDDAPSVSIADTSIVEGNSGTSVLRFTITSSTNTNITVNAATASSGTATGGAFCSSGTDFVSRAVTAVTLTRGTGTFDVTVCGDTDIEPNETVNVVLTPIIGASYTISTANATGTISNDDQNLAPVAPTYSFSTNNDLASEVTVDLLSQATDDRDPASALQVALLSSVDPQVGVISGLTGSTFTFKPYPGYVGVVTLSYSVKDSAGLSTTGSVVITVGNAPLIAVDDDITTLSGTTTVILPLDNDRNVGSGSMTISVSRPKKGTATVSGTVVFYEHRGGATTDETDDFTYTVKDSSGNTLAVGTVNVSIQPNRGVIKIRDLNDSVLIDAEISSGIDNDPTVCKAVVEATNLYPGTAYTLKIFAQGVGQGGETLIETYDNLYPGSAKNFPGSDPSVGSESLQVYIGDKLMKGQSYKATLTAGTSHDSISSKVFSTCPLPDAVIDDVTVVEGDSGTGTMSFKISTTGKASYSIHASISTSGNDAATGGESCADEGVDFIDPGTTTIDIVDGKPAYFDVTYCGETLYEDDESFTVTLSKIDPNDPDVTILDPTGLGTIENDDNVTLSVDDKEIVEGDSGTQTLVFDIGAVDNGGDVVDIDVDVTVSTAGDPDGRNATNGAACADEGVDFVAPSSSALSIVDGEATFSVIICSDTLYEGDETFSLDLTPVSTGTSYRDEDVETDGAIGTILDDDGIVLGAALNDDQDDLEADDERTLMLFNDSDVVGPGTTPEKSQRTYTVKLANRSKTTSYEVELVWDAMPANVDRTVTPGPVDGTYSVDPEETISLDVVVSAIHRSEVPRGDHTMTVTANVDGTFITDTTLDLHIRRRLEVQTGSGSRVYLDPNPAFTMAFEGFISADDESAGTTAINGSRSCSSTATLTSPVSSYTNLCTSSSSWGQYDVIDYLPGTLTITKRPVTIRANSFSRQVTETNPPLTWTVTGVARNQINGITCTSPGNGVPAGGYSITCSASPATVSNFDITFIPGNMIVFPGTTTTTTTAPPSTTAAPTTTTPPAPTTTTPPTTVPLAPTPTTSTTLPGGGVVVEQQQPPEEGDTEVIETTDNDDIVDVKEGDKEVKTGGGDDKVSLGKGNDKVDGGQGSDRIDTGDGDDEVNGGDGDDELVDFEGKNQMTAGNGNDKIVTGSAAGGEVDGGDGDDTFYKFVERELDIEEMTKLLNIENVVVVFFDCAKAEEFASLQGGDLLSALNLESDSALSISTKCRPDPMGSPELNEDGEMAGLPLKLSDIFDTPQSDEYYLRKTFEEMVNIAWARVEAQRPRFSNWIRQQGVDGVQTYCARTPFPCSPIPS